MPELRLGSISAAIVVAALALLAPEVSRSKPALTEVSIPEASEGGTTVNLRAWLAKPDGPGPFSAVILAHGCNGVDPRAPGSAWASMNEWAEWLNQQGYAALILDSFAPRGVSTVCGGTMGDERTHELLGAVSGDLRGLDIFVAADYLARMPQFDPQSIAAIGFSHGGAAVVRAAAEDNVTAGPGRKALAADHGRIAAFVGMYPGCKRSVRSTFLAPLYILIGTDDVRTSAQICERLAGNPRSSGSPVTIKVYQGATHSFDVEKPDRITKVGDRMAYSAEATADARARIKTFLAEHLGSKGAAAAH